MKKIAMIIALAMANESAAKNLESLIDRWAKYFEQHAWQSLIEGYEPKATSCGIVYELPNALGVPDEGLAIVDMRTLAVMKPHYHPDGCYEVYFVLQGTALVVIANVEQQVKAGDIIIVPPNKAHYMIPDKECVIGVINTPPYTPESYIPLTTSRQDVAFDAQRFKTLTDHQ